jgi:hypothetical protein
MLLLVAFAYSCSYFSGCYCLLSPSLLTFLPMVCVMHTSHPIGDEAHPEASDVASQEVTEALSSQVSDFAGAASSPSREVSLVDTGDSESESRSMNPDNELTASDSNLTMRAKVSAVVTVAGMTFNFGASNVGKVRIRAMECLLLPEGSRLTARPGNCAHTLGR